MKPLKILFVLCIMLGFALPANSQGKQVERPFKGIFYAHVTKAGPIEELAINGNATHVGNFTGKMYFDHSSLKVGPNGEILDVTISGTIVAANGDEIEFGPDNPGMKFNNFPIDLSTGTMSADINLNPGTGRFANCSGVITTTGIFDMGNDYAMWTAEGWIKY